MHCHVVESRCRSQRNTAIVAAAADHTGSAASGICARIIRSPINHGLNRRVISAHPNIGPHSRFQNAFPFFYARPITLHEGLSVEQVKFRRVGSAMTNSYFFSGVKVCANAQKRFSCATAISQDSTVVQSQIIPITPELRRRHDAALGQNIADIDDCQKKQ